MLKVCIKHGPYTLNSCHYCLRDKNKRFDDEKFNNIEVNMSIEEEDYEKYKMVTSSEDWVDVSCAGVSYMEFVNILTGETARFPYDLQHYNNLIQ